jgi:hypothetical protein
MVEMQNRKWKVDSLLFASDNIFMFTHSKWKSTQEVMDEGKYGTFIFNSSYLSVVDDNNLTIFHVVTLWENYHTLVIDLPWMDYNSRIMIYFFKNHSWLSYKGGMIFL